MKSPLLAIIFLFIPFVLFAQSADITSGCAPLDVTFSAPASSSSYFWDFQDGTFSSLADPVNTFTNPGTYLVEFRENAAGPVLGTVNIEVFEVPDIDVTADIQSGCAPLTVNFQSILGLPPGASVTNIEWVFGDGTAVTGIADPQHTFTNAGNYFVSLSVETDFTGCSNTVIFQDFISVTPGPEAIFSSDPDNLSSCDAPFVVNFSGQATGTPPIAYQWSFGNGNSSNAANPPAQTYPVNGTYDLILIVTDATACTDTLVTEVGVGAPNASFSIGDPICAGQPLNIINNSTPGSYSWDFGPDANPSTASGPNPNVSIDGEGAYDISLTLMTFGGQCVDDTTVTVLVDRVDATVSSTPDFSCDQPLTVNFNAVTNEALSFLWEFADGTTSNQQNPSHTYFIPTDSFSVNELEVLASTVTITNPSGCEETFTVRDTIFRPNALFMPDIVQGCAPLTVTFSDSSTSADPIILWDWDFGDGNSQQTNTEDDVAHTYTAPGEYQVRLRIQNASGCIDTSYAIQIEVGATLSPDFSVDQSTVCQGESVQFTDLTGSPDIDAWHYETEDGRSFHCFGSGNPSWAYEQVTGPQDVTLIVEYNGCYSEVTMPDLITVNGPIARIDYSKSCEQPFLVNFADSSLDATTVSWDFGDTNTSNQSDPAHTYASSGNYLVTLTAENPATGCPASTDTATIYIRDIEANIITDSTLCLNAPVTLDASNSQDVNVSCSKGYTWHFSDPTLRPLIVEDSSTTVSFPNPGPQTIQLVVEDINGCRDTATQEIKVYQVIADFAQDELEICIPNTVTFSDSTQADTTLLSWEWSFGDGGTSGDQNPVHDYTMPNPGGFLITLVVTDVIGCMDSITKPLSLLEPMVALLTDPDPTNICVGEDITFRGDPLIGAPDFLDYTWNFGNGQTASDSVVTTSYQSPGTYDVVMTFVDPLSGCSGVETVSVNVQDFPDAGFFSNTDSLPVLCFPQNILFSDTSQGMDLSYFWDFGNGNTAVGQNTATVFDKGEQTVTLFVSTSFGCTDSVSQNYTVVGPEGFFDLEPDIICAGQSVSFNLTDTVDVESWTWFYGDGVSETDVNPVEHPYLIEPPSGFTTVKLVLSGQQGQCETTVEQNLFYDSIIADFIRNDGVDTALCVGDYPFTSNSINADQFVWVFGDGNTGIGATTVNTYEAAGSFDVTMIATNTTLGCVDSITKPVVLLPNPAPLAVGTGHDLGESSQILILNADFNSSYIWFPAESLSDSSAINPFSFATESTIYTVVQTDENRCIGQDTALVEVDKVRPVFIPNAFTPDNNGVNDVFMIFSSPAVRAVRTFQIFDRWGELVFSAEDFIPNDPSFGWDGTLNGNTLRPGVFVYFAEVEFIDNFIEFYKGDLTLIR